MTVDSIEASSNQKKHENAKRQGVQYEEYLQLDKVLDAQKPLSNELGKNAHDEMLFIVVHQAHELWFKQILTELNSIIEIFSQEKVNDRLMNLAVARLQRITQIQKLLIDQLRVLESMTPHDFLEFRRFLSPASGFQSVQFRTLETLLGFLPNNRFSKPQCVFASSLRDSDAEALRVLSSSASLFSCVEKWLERTPFLRDENFDFWQEYRQKTLEMQKLDESSVQNSTVLNTKEKTQKLSEVAAAYASFQALFSQSAFDEELKQGLRRLSFNATKAALFIHLYRDEPVLQLPFRILTSLVDIDELLQQWRGQHATMVHRMIGIKIGTGGSMGYPYLRSTLDGSKIFGDFASLSTYLIPRESLPVIPQNVLAKMSFAT